MIKRIKPGDVFSHWIVTAFSHSHRSPNGNSIPVWKCRCDCGTERGVRAEHLRSGKSSCCGCVGNAKAAKREYVHGGRYTKLYDVWVQMLQRCENKKNKAYRNYGGRGIAVCERWHDFALFRSDVEPSHAEGLSLDRYPNNDGNYEPGNWRWATPKEQARNVRTNRLVTYDGKTQPLSAWAEEIGMKPMTLYERIVTYKWPVYRAITEAIARPLADKPF